MGDVFMKFKAFKVFVRLLLVSFVVSVHFGSLISFLSGGLRMDSSIVEMMLMDGWNCCTLYYHAYGYGCLACFSHDSSRNIRCKYCKL